MNKNIRVLIGGIGNANRPLIDLIRTERERMQQKLGLQFQIVGVTDSQGSAVSSDGISCESIINAKTTAGTVAAMPIYGRPGMSALQMIECCDADVYIESLPPFLPDGEPGSSTIRMALNREMHVVTANKAPLALYWGELFALAERKGKKLRFSAAASAGLPTLEMGSLLGCCGELLEFAGIFNASCMYVIGAMNQGKTFDAAVEGARQGGFLEPNPSMDLDGWDTAMKTVIQANAYWHTNYSLADVSIQGIRGLTQKDLELAETMNETWCMVGRAAMTASGLTLRAGPERLPLNHPLAKARWCDKVLWMRTRTQGEQVHDCLGASASGTPGSIFLDLVAIARGFT